MPVTCTGGMVEVGLIVDLANQNETNIGINTAALVATDDRVILNESTIDNHHDRLVVLESADSAVTDALAQANEIAIADLALLIDTNTTDIGDNGMQVATNTAAIATNLADIVINKAEADANSLVINDHEARLAVLEAAAGIIVASPEEVLLVHETADLINGGTSVANTWSPRNIQTVRYNTAGAVVGPTAVTLQPGTYRVHAFAIVSGSAHQSRLSIGAGVEYVYGTTCDTGGQSTIIADVVLAASTTLELETNVETAVIDTGFGAANVFGTFNVYTTLKIEKVQ